MMNVALLLFKIFFFIPCIAQVSVTVIIKRERTGSLCARELQLISHG